MKAQEFSPFQIGLFFLGNKYERNSQIGNAVPPLLALALSKSVDECFKKWEQNNEQG